MTVNPMPAQDNTGLRGILPHISAQLATISTAARPPWSITNSLTREEQTALSVAKTSQAFQI